MLDLISVISEEINISKNRIQSALKLREEGGTVPFIARYRKEATENLDEIMLREIFDRHDYYTELEKRKLVIIESIVSQGKMTDEIQNLIASCRQKNTLEDIYLPYKPKRRTKASIAREKGLEPLALYIKESNILNSPQINLEAEAEKYISPEKGVESIKDALSGAQDIIAEEIGDKAELRSILRDYIFNKGIFKSSIKEEFPEGTTKYEMYRKFEKPVKDITPHNMLALRRGEAEGIINLDLDFDENAVLEIMNSLIIFTHFERLNSFYKTAVKDAFNRLIKHSIIGEIRMMKKEFADEQSIRVFGDNLRQMLLAPPAGMKPAMGIDPGFRTGCKVVILSKTGQFEEYKAIFPHNSKHERDQAAKYIIEKISEKKIELIAIGNGTASRETDEFITEVLNNSEIKPVKVIVSEQGASIYSAGENAGKEFPHLDVTVRGAISIGRRLQDPLSELVKIDPKSIGVGQYQHDVDQKLLKKKLEETVESCVNYVGVDLNNASKELLNYVSGLNDKIAENIISYRNENGAFENRMQLKKVPKIGAKTFEQAAGFLRIRNSSNPLDNTAVHPESYYIVEKIASDLNLDLKNINKLTNEIKNINFEKYIDDKIGELTLKDIFAELEKPGRDPREVFKYASFKEGITEIKHLKAGMVLEGIVTNITNFGCFVDIGVHQDGLVHISEMSDSFIKDVTKVVKVGQIVNVRVVEVNEKLKRIQLSMKNESKKKMLASETKNYSINDLKSKFSL